MRDVSIKTLQEVVGGKLRLAALEPRDGELTRLGRIVTKSSLVRTGDIFWQLDDESDRSRAADEAFRRGARGVVCQGYIQPWPRCWSLEVESSDCALERLCWNRRRMTGPVVAVAGNASQSLAAAMIGAVLGSRMEGSREVDHGAASTPLARLLEIEAQHEYSLIELPASTAGEMAELAAIARPTIGVVTVGDLADTSNRRLDRIAQDRIIAASVQLIQSLPNDAWAIVDGDDERLRRLAPRRGAKIAWVGRSPDCDLVASDVERRGGELSFSVQGYRMRTATWVSEPLCGVLAAVAVGQILGFSLAEIAASFAEFDPPPPCSQIHMGQGATISSDSHDILPFASHGVLEPLTQFTGRRGLRIAA